MRTLRISVRRLVEFLLRSGDIDSEHDWRGGIEAMQAGSSIHRMLQASGGEAYQAEVSLASSIYFPGGSFNPHAARLEIRENAVDESDGFFLRIEGRADGIIDDGTHPLVIDEIKGVLRDVSGLDEPAAVHEAQALCYAYLYLRGTRGASTLASAYDRQVVVRLTYASMTTGEVRQIERTHTLPDIESWFFSLLEKAQRWAAWRVEHDKLRTKSLSSLTFPLSPRSGQRELMDAVASAIRKGERLYAQAPTGSGKTIATLFPALKAMGSGKCSRIAYLTAKTMTRRPALECIDLLRQQGFAANVLVVTARNKICPLRDATHGAEMRSRPLASLCNPLECPLARGHYDAVNEALYEAITTCDVLDARRIGEVAERHHVCPYELQRDATRWSDVIICDYHYAFAPSASLLGLADEPDGGSTVFLVDEAHNLVERMREMYSAELSVSELKGLERLLRAKSTFGQLAMAVRAVVSAFPTWDKSLPTSSSTSPKGRGRPSYQVIHIGEEFSDALAALADGMGTALDQFFPSMSNGHEHGDDGTARDAFGQSQHFQRGHRGDATTPRAASGSQRGHENHRTATSAVGQKQRGYADRAAATSDTGQSQRGYADYTSAPNGQMIEIFLALRDMSLKINALLGALQRSQTGYVSFLGRDEHGGRQLKIYCVNPSHDLDERLEQAKAAIFFSGTLLPMDYHRKLLAAQDHDASLYVQSSFDHRYQQILIASDVSARFSQRGPNLYAHIAAYLVALVRARPGNYLAFLPSYAMMEEIAGALSPLMDNKTTIVRQRPRMREAERERFVAKYREAHDADESLVGLCVLGGIFGESIDLPGQTLVGVVVVGTGMPRTSGEREVIRDYFDSKEGKGFAYAYTYPGLSKVLQAAGRLIRTEKDRGVVLLLDDRFLGEELRGAFPKEWKNIQSCTLETMPRLLERQ